jgi:hypothetical protein
MVQYTVLNAVTFIVGLAFLYNGYRIVRHGREALALFGMSAIVGSGLIAVALYPNLLTATAAALGVRVADRAVLVFAILTLFVIVTYLFHQLGELYESVSRLNEEVSLLRTELEERND